MQLYYYRDPIGNFGDDLNAWLWPQLIPELLDGDASTLFVGIGTLINDQIPAEPRKIIFGAGVGYFGPARVDERWDIRFVRGPRSAAALGLPPSAAVTDGALLVRAVMEPGAGTGPVSFIPHHASVIFANWRRIAADAGLRYIDPTADPRKVLAEIASSRLVVTEAMHGAILADALRVPWVGVRAYKHINETKWRDWGETADVPITLHPLPTVHDRTHANPLRRAAEWVRQMRRTRTLRLRPIPREVTPPATRAAAVARLAELARGADAVLSPEPTHARLLARLQDEVQRLRADHARGRPAGTA